MARQLSEEAFRPAAARPAGSPPFAVPVLDDTASLTTTAGLFGLLQDWKRGGTCLQAGDIVGVEVETLGARRARQVAEP